MMKKELRTPPQPSPEGREEDGNSQDQNSVMITIDWLKEKHDKFSFDGMLKTIIALNKVTNFWCCYVSDVNDVSEETYNALEAFGFDIAYKGDDEMGHYYLIKWGEVE